MSVDENCTSERRAKIVCLTKFQNSHKISQILDLDTQANLSPQDGFLDSDMRTLNAVSRSCK